MTSRERHPVGSGLDADLRRQLLDVVREVVELERHAAAPQGAVSPATRYLGRFASAHSRRTMGSALCQIARLASGDAFDEKSFPWPALRAPQVAVIRSVLAAGPSETTANRYLAALRGVLQVCHTQGLISTSDWDAVRVAARGLPPRRGRVPALPPHAIGALYRACDDGTSLGARDAAVVTALLAGATKAEVIALMLDDWDGVRRKLWFRGRKRRNRRIELQEQPARALDRWVRVRGTSPGALLTPMHGPSGRARIRPLRPGTIDEIVQRRTRLAGLGRMRADALRRRALARHATTHDENDLRIAAGHARRRTTRRYLPADDSPSDLPPGALDGPAVARRSA